jgi:hypothetical protein
MGYRVSDINVNILHSRNHNQLLNTKLSQIQAADFRLFEANAITMPFYSAAMKMIGLVA